MDVLANLRMAVAKMCFTDGGQAGTRGNGLSLVYPSWSSPTHPLSTFGAAARGSSVGEFGIAK